MTASHTWRSAVACGYCPELAYPTRKVAKAARAARHDPTATHVYRCPAGGTGYHLGSRPAETRGGPP